jgi:hypothetical protein
LRGTCRPNIAIFSANEPITQRRVIIGNRSSLGREKSFTLGLIRAKAHGYMAMLATMRPP